MAAFTDTIPRVSVGQIFGGLQYLAARGGRSTFDAVRIHFLSTSNRKSPNTATVMWTVARDVLSELEKLKLATVGVLPRKLSDVQRLHETPCEITQAGAEMAQLHNRKPGQAYDALLIRWLAEHSYFRQLVARLLESPLYVPDVTNMGQLGLGAVRGTAPESVVSNLVNNCSSRLEAIGWAPEKLEALISGIDRRSNYVEEVLRAADIDAKRLIDVVQDNVVLPAFLEAEGLPFDPVTFQQLLKCAQEFFCAAWTTSHPRFNGRIAFATCGYDVPPNNDRETLVAQVMHHGLTYAEPMFVKAIREAYIAAAGTTSAYVSAYAIRALVCVELRIPLLVFARCLESLIATGQQGELTVYTELPFEPPPQGESYVEVGKRRIGRLKLVYNKEG